MTTTAEPCIDDRPAWAAELAEMMTQLTALQASRVAAELQPWHAGRRDCGLASRHRRRGYAPPALEGLLTLGRMLEGA